VVGAQRWLRLSLYWCTSTPTRRPSSVRPS